MVGDFMVCVDRIVASTACFDSGNGARDGLLRREEEEEGSSEIKRRESDGGFNNGESLKKMKKKEEGNAYKDGAIRKGTSHVKSATRQGWGTRIDLHDSHLLAIAAAEQELLNAEYEEYAAVHNNGIACCRSVALILMLLLLVRHVLMVIRDAGMVQDASDFFNLSLQFAGFLLPCYLIIQSCYVLQSRRRRQV
ncbi:uncharacterized protein A4U43_C04F19830 [Asparagus officinalis]|uniref:Uncharacterized protein n=1 Tax=Asparagus officinalis TaxID=4686 RepID=A0A5P1F284_ASPOF|nr:uncharacterized protein A4U43_C04F19830 [Asparagus officinalis]